MADCWQVRVVHRFVWFGFDGETNFFVVREHFVECLDEEVNAATSILRFAQVSALAGEPEDEDVCLQIIRDIDRTQGAFDGEFPAFRIIAGVSAIDGHRAEPETRSDHFGSNAGITEPLFESLRFLWICESDL